MKKAGGMMHDSTWMGWQICALALAVLVAGLGVIGCGDTPPPPAPPVETTDAGKAEVLQQEIEFNLQQLQTDPDNSEAHIRLGIAYAELGDTPAAARYWQQAITLDPDNLNTRMLLARLLVAGRDFAAASEQLREIIAREPDHVGAYTLQAQVYQQAGDYPAARKTYLWVLHFWPEDEKTLTALTDLFLEWGAAARRDGNYDTAVRVINEGLQYRPDAPEFLYALAQTYQASGELGRAAHLLDGLVARFPEERRYLYTLSAMYQERERYADAYRLWQEFGAVNQLTADDHVRFAELLGRMGRTERQRAEVAAAGDDLSPVGWVIRGEVLLTLSDTAAARNAWRRALQEDTATGILQRVAELEYTAGDRDVARADYRELHERQPLAAPVGVRLAELQIAAGDGETAVATLAPLFRAYPEERAVAAALQAAELLRVRTAAPDVREEVYTAARDLLGARPELQLAYAEALLAQGRGGQARDIARTVPAETAGRALLLVRIYSRLGDDAPLPDLVAQGLAEDPDEPYLLFQKGLLHYRRQEWDAAENAFRRSASVADAAMAGPAYLWVAEICDRRGDLPGALVAYRQAFAVGADARWLIRYADAAERSGDHRLARQLYEQRLAVAPEDNRAIYGLARFFIGAGDRQQALTYWRQLTERVPTNAQAWYYLGFSLYHEGQYREALPHFLKALEQKTDFWEAAYAAAMDLRRLDDMAQATEYARQAATLSANNPRTVFLLAQLLKEQGDASGAAAALEPVLASPASEPAVLLLRAMLYRDEKQYADAARLLVRYLKLEPDDQEALTLLADIYGERAYAAATAGDYRAAQRYADDAVKCNPRQGEAMVTLGAVAAHGQHYEQAIHYWQQYLAYGGRRQVRALMGQALLALGRSEEAMTAFREAVDAGESDTRALSALIEHADAVDDLAGMLRYLKRWVEVDPHDNAARFRLAQAQAQAGEELDAIRNLQRVLARDPLNARAYYQLGELYSRRQEYAAAAKVFRQALRLDPDNVVTHYDLGLICRQTREFTAALEHFRRVVELRPGWEEGLYQLANTYLDTFDYADAIRIGQRLLEHDETADRYRELLLKAHRNYARWLIERDEADAALLQAERALQQQPDDLPALLLRGYILGKLERYDEAIRDFQEVLRRDPDQIDARVQLGNVYYAQRLFDLAFVEYQDAMNRDPSRPEPYIRLGMLYTALNNPEEANRHLQKARELNSEVGATHLGLARLAMNEGDYNQAVTELRRTLELSPRTVDAYLELSRVYQKMGFHSESLDVLRQALTIAPDNFKVHFQLGVVLEDAGDVLAASEEYRKTLTLQPRFGEAHHNLGEIYRSRGQLPEAENAYTAALSDPGFKYRAFSYNGLGLIEVERGNQARAEEYFQRALEHMPDYVEASLNLASLYWQRGNLDAARARAEQIIQANHLEHRAYYLLALIYDSSGNRSQAWDYLEKAMKIEPGSQEYQALNRRWRRGG